jgi:hypothetical protein
VVGSRGPSRVPLDELQAISTVRITDRYNSADPASQPFNSPATTADVSLPVTVPYAATTDDTIGSTCAVATSANAVLAGAVNDAKRTIWQLGQVEVTDGGEDGQASTMTDNTLFAKQGVFAP